MSTGYRFGDFVLSGSRRELHRGDDEVVLQPQVFDVLLYLVERRDEVVTKNEILDDVWGDRFVSESVLSTRIKEVRRAVGDSGRAQELVRTYHGRGFRWIAPTKAFDESTEDADVPPEAPPVDATQPNARAHRLPRPVELIGRADAVTTVTEAIRRGGFANLVGPGGVGKTTLAIEAGRHLEAEHPGGVILCELASLRAGEVASGVLDTITGSAGSGEGAPEQVVAALGDGPSLLIVDNCEHVVDEVAKFVSNLLELAEPGQVSVLATSREALDIRGERVVRLGGLPGEHDDDPGVELFLRRSRAVSVDLDDGPTTMAAVRHIVRLVDGLPLAIEMAASRLISTTPEQLAVSLGENVLDLGARRRYDERQSTVGRTVAWSVDLLSAAERRGLVDLAVFLGSFTATAAAEVLDDDPDYILHRLVDQSLVTIAGAHEAVRYRLYEPTRQYVDGLLDDDRRELLRARHARYFADLGLRLADALWTPEAAAASVRLSAEWNDLGRALAWGREHGDVEVAIDPLLALGLHLQWQLRVEGFRWLAEGLQSGIELDDDRVALARPLQAMGAIMAGDFELAQRAVLGLTHPAAQTVKLFIGILSGNEELLVDGGTSHEDHPDHPAAWRQLGRGRALIAQSFVDADGTHARELVERVRADIEPCSGVPAPDLWSHTALITHAIRTGNLAAIAPVRAELDRIAASTGLRWFATLIAGMTKSADESGAERIGIRPALVQAKAVVNSQDRSILPWALRTLIIELHAAGRDRLAATMIGVLEANDEISSYERDVSFAFERAEREIRDERLERPTYDRLVAAGRHMSLTTGLAEVERVLDDPA